MEKDDYITPVIFRKFPEGDIIALFPTEPGNYNFGTCNSYMHIGQHSSASIDLIDATKPATKEEYGDLFEELESEGYNLKVYQRIQPWMNQERCKELHRDR